MFPHLYFYPLQVSGPWQRESRQQREKALTTEKCQSQEIKNDKSLLTMPSYHQYHHSVTEPQSTELRIEALVRSRIGEWLNQKSCSICQISVGIIPKFRPVQGVKILCLAYLQIGFMISGSKDVPFLNYIFDSILLFFLFLPIS